MASIRSVLIVDDQRNEREAIAEDLQKKGYDVAQTEGYQGAVTCLQESPAAFVLLDRALGTGRVEDRGLQEICAVAGAAHVIVYTDKEEVSLREEYRIKERGAIRVIDRRDVGPSLDVFSRELDELLALSTELKSFKGERSHIVAALVGIDVGVTIIDKEYHCWFANEQQNNLVGGECTGGLCWKVFHSIPGEHGPCWGCGVTRAIKIGEERERVFLSRFRDDRLGWVRVRTKPALVRGEQTLAVREAVSRFDPSTISVKSRLSAIAQGLLQIGFGQARIFRVKHDGVIFELAAAASVTDNVWAETSGYYDTVAHTADDIRIERCPYAKRAHDSFGQQILVDQWDGQLGPSPFAEAFQFGPPYVDIPVWKRGDPAQIVGWISADLVGLEAGAAEAVRMEWLNLPRLGWVRDKFGAELADALAAEPPEQQRQDETLQRAEMDVVGAKSVDAALEAVRTAEQTLAPGCRVSVRIKYREGELTEYEDLCVGTRAAGTPETINIHDRRSLASVAYSSVKPVWVKDRRVLAGLPRGYAPETCVSTASVPLVVEGIVVGTMSIDSTTTIDWEAQGFVRPLERLARLVALVVRDITFSSKTDREDVAAYAASTLRTYVDRREIEEALRSAAEYATTLSTDLRSASPGLKKLAGTVLNAIEDARRVLGERPERRNCRLVDVLTTLKNRLEAVTPFMFDPAAPTPGNHSLAIPEPIVSWVLDTLLKEATTAARAENPVPAVLVSAAVKGRDVVVHVTPGTTIRGSDLIVARGAAIAYGGDLKLEESGFRLRVPVV